MSGLLINAEKISSPELSEKDFICQAWNYHGNKYLLVLNGSKEKQTLLVRDFFRAQELSVIKENRVITLEKGVLRDEFDPFTVHLYAESELPDALRKLPGKLFSRNPYHDAIERRLNFRSYEGSALWIWERETSQSQGSDAWLKKTFSLKQLPKAARIWVAADDSASLSLNGQGVGTHRSWSVLQEYDLLPFLRIGENDLTAAVADSGHLPCGFLADILITMPDGRKITILSDESWLGARTANGTYQPVKVIAPYGAGAWQKRVEMPEKLLK